MLVQKVQDMFNYMKAIRKLRFGNEREYTFSLFLSLLAALQSCKERNLVILHLAHRSRQF